MSLTTVTALFAEYGHVDFPTIRNPGQSGTFGDKRSPQGVPSGTHSLKRLRESVQLHITQKENTYFMSYFTRLTLRILCNLDFSKSGGH